MIDQKAIWLPALDSIQYGHPPFHHRIPRSQLPQIHFGKDNPNASNIRVPKFQTFRAFPHGLPLQTVLFLQAESHCTASKPCRAVLHSSPVL